MCTISKIHYFEISKDFISTMVNTTLKKFTYFIITLKLSSFLDFGTPNTEDIIFSFSIFNIYTYRFTVKKILPTKVLFFANF